MKSTNGYFRRSSRHKRALEARRRRWVTLQLLANLGWVLDGQGRQGRVKL